VLKAIGEQVCGISRLTLTTEFLFVID